MKKIILGALVLMLAVSLTGCGKTKQEKAVDDFTKKMEDINKDVTKEMEKVGKAMKKEEKKTKQEVGNMIKNGKEVKEGVNNTGEENMSMKLKMLKRYRNCLENASTKKRAVTCFEETNQLSMKNGLEDGSADFDQAMFGEWSSNDKERVLKILDKSENYMKNSVK